MSAAGTQPEWALRRDQMVLPAARVISTNGAPPGSQGSGFVIAVTHNGTYVLTNHHVIKDAIHQEDRWDPVEKSSKKVERLQRVTVEIFRYDERGCHMQTISTSADIVAYQQYGDKWSFEGDMALLRLCAPVEGVPAAHLISEEEYMAEVRVLDDIVMVGCPEKCELPLPSKGHIASLSEERGGVGLMLSQLFGNQGSSGSAVFRFSPERETYEIVAVHCLVDYRGSFTDVGKGSYLRLAIPVPSVHGFLKRSGFAHLIAKPAAGGNADGKPADDAAFSDGASTAASDGAEDGDGDDEAVDAAPPAEA